MRRLLGLRPPGWMQSIRFRLTVLYSAVVFLLAATVLGVTYFAVQRSTDTSQAAKSFQAKVFELQGGEKVYRGTLEVAAVEEFESEVNRRTLTNMRTFGAAALGGLFLISLGTGWVLSGRALRPVRAIAETAEEIQATDLSRRIRLGGPRDELRYLGDTIDAMLDRLQAAFAAQRQLIDDASHELRTPLAIIRANLDTSLVSEEAGEAERRHAVTVIDRATSRMSGLVEDLLATARRDAGGLPDADVSLDVVAREAGEDFTVLAAGRGLTLRYALHPGFVAIGDHDALRRAVSNLVSNAVRLAPAGSTVTISCGAVQGWCWVAVADQGPGIPDADRSRIFDRFFRGTGAARDGQGDGRGPGELAEAAGGAAAGGAAGSVGVERAVDDGSGSRERHAGLGLAIVRQIVESHGGRVVVFSEVGVGSTFVMWLPDGARPPGHSGSRTGSPPDLDPTVAPVAR
jgi:signal transduction histidine kinase